MKKYTSSSLIRATLLFLVLTSYNYTLAQYSYQQEWGSDALGLFQFKYPQAVKAAPDGSFYVSDQNALYKFSAAGELLAQRTDLGYIYSISLDASNNLVISSYYQIYRLTPTLSTINSFGNYGTADGQVSNIRDLKVGPDGNVYVLDQIGGNVPSNGTYRVQVFSPSGTFIGKVIADDAGYYNSNTSYFYNQVAKMEVGNNRIYLAGYSYGYGVPTQSRIREYSLSGALISTFGSWGTGNGQFLYVQGLTLDLTGNLVVTDQNRVQKLTPAGAFISALNYQYGADLSFQADGNILIIQTNYDRRVQRLSPSGTILASFGEGTLPGQFKNPRDVVEDSEGNMYVLDNENFRVQKFNASGQFVLQFGSQGGGNGQFYNPYKLAINSSNELFILDAGQRIVKFDQNGNFILSFGSYGTGDSQFSNTQDFDIDKDGNIYVPSFDGSSYAWIKKFSSTGTFISKWGAFGEADNQLNSIYSIVVDSDNNLYINNYSPVTSYRLKKFTTTGTFLETVLSGMWSNDLEIDQFNNVYSLWSNQIIRINPDKSYTSVFFSNGNTAFEGSGFYISPNTGKILIADYGYNNKASRIMKLGCSIPQPEFSASPALPGSLTSFTDQSLNIAPSASYLWNFGDGSASTVKGNVQHTYDSAGMYTTSLSISQGCFARRVQSLNLSGIQTDSLALVAFYNATNGASWYSKTNWLTGPLSTWYGVTVQNKRVVQLRLAYSLRGGALPSGLGNLSALETLDLSGNDLTGTIPVELSNLTELKNLSLSSNRFSGSLPAHLSSLPKLESLNLRMNEFTGSIPAAWGSITTLKELQISENKLTGEVPASFVNLSSIQTLQILNNQLSGPLPDFISSLTTLRLLYISNNRFTGPLPASWGNLVNLVHLQADQNQLTGTIPASFGNLTNLTLLTLSSNQFSGSLPPELGNMTSLQALYLLQNAFSGSLPSTINNLKNLRTLYISYNQFSGPLPDMSGMSGLDTFLSSDNQLSGTLPASLGSLPQLSWLNLSNNQLSGNLPSELAMAPRLRDITLTNNLLSGALPLNWGSQMSSIYLGRNQFTGSIPQAFVTMSSASIDVSYNKLSGSLPAPATNYLQINISNNELTGLPAFQGGAYISVQAANNYFSFEDIEPNLSFYGFSYAPQKLVAAVDSIQVTEGDSLRMSFSVGGSANHYQWFRNNSSINGANDSTYQVPTVSVNDAGEYYLRITSSIVPSLTLETERITVIVLPSPAASEPVAQPTNFLFSNITTNSLQATFAAAAGNPDGYLVVRRKYHQEFATLSGFDPDQQLTLTFDATGTLLEGQTNVYAYMGIIQTDTDNPLSEPWYSVVGNWGQDDGIGKMTAVAGYHNRWQLILQPTLRQYFNAAPTDPLRYLAVVFRTPNGMLQTRPDFYLDLTGSPQVIDPLDGVEYSTASVLGYDSVVYAGNGNSFAQTTLNLGNTYTYQVYSFNGSGGNINYRQASPLTGSVTTSLPPEFLDKDGDGFTGFNDCNDNDATIYPGAPELCDGKDNNCDGTIDEGCSVQGPTLSSANIVFNNILATSMDMTFTPGNGTRRLVVMKQGSLPEFVPADNVLYQNDLGNGELAVYNGSDSTMKLTSLLPDAEYFVRIYEYNSDSVSVKYLVTDVPSASQRTLVQPNVYVTTPTDSALNLAITLNVTARALTGATAYTLELNDVQDFTGNSLVKSGTRTQNFTGLSYATRYYTRVKTNLSPAYGKVTTFQTRTPNIYVTSPANNAVNLSTTLNVTAATLTGATLYTIELNEVPDFSGVGFVQTGARTQSFTGLKNGQQYYTRVKTDIYPVYGQVTTFTTAIPNVYVTTPANASLNQNSTLNISARTLTGATEYTIELNEAADFSGEGFIQSGSRTQSFAGLKYNTQYFARVRTDLSPVYGKTTTFITADASFFAYVTNPANTATGRNANLNLTSNTVLGAAEYTIQLSESSDFTSVAFEATGPTRTLAFNGLKYSTTYYNRVRTDLSSQFGQVRSFTTRSAEGLAYVTSPADGAVDRNVNLNISSQNVPNATEYTIQLSETNNFSTLAFEATGSTRTLAFSGLKYNTTYYSRVITNAEVTFDYGPTRSFTTRTAESISYVTSPSNIATGVNNSSVNVSSNTVPGAALYTIQLSEDADFTTIDFEKSGPTRTLNFTGLKYGTTYYNRVLTDLTIIYGEVRSFTTRTAESLAYVTSPANTASGVNTTVNITSNTVPGASQYTIQLSESADFSVVAFENTGNTRTRNFSGLLTGTTYYNRVRTDLSPAFGQVRSFTTAGSPPGGRMAAENPEPLLEKFTVKAYPNPFQQRFSISIESSVYPEVKIILTDMNGRDVHESIEKTNTRIELEDELAIGIYLLKVYAGAESKVLKVVKAK